MLGPTHLEVWRRSLVVVGSLIALVLVAILLRLMLSTDWEPRDDASPATVLLGGFIAWFYMLALTAQVARLAIPGVKRLEQDRSLGTPHGPTRRTWFVIWGGSFVVFVVVRFLPDELLIVANPFLLAPIGRYAIWPIIDRREAMRRLASGDQAG